MRLWNDFDGEPFLINPGGELAIFNRPRPRRRRKVRARKRSKIMARVRTRRRRRRVVARRRVRRNRPRYAVRRRRVYRRRARRNVPALAGLLANPRRRRRRRSYTRNRRRHSYRRNPSLPFSGGMLGLTDIGIGVGAALVMNYATVPAANYLGVTDRFGLKFRGVQAGVGIVPPLVLAYMKVIPRGWAKAWITASIGAVALDLARDYSSGLLRLGYYNVRGGTMNGARGLGRGVGRVASLPRGLRYEDAVSDSYGGGGSMGANAYGSSPSLGYYRVGG